MPANILSINKVSDFYVGDSKMPELIAWLKKNAKPQNKEARKLFKVVK